MVDARETLTDKEKETLRLMVRGHDAKSAATELDLSVHTINERLRAARRKLEVTSSREAARLLLESEGGAYENLADKELGEVGSTESGEVGRVAAGKPARRMLAGVLVMMTIFAAGLILTSFSADTARQAAPAEISASDAAVVAAARDWLALTDASDWQASFDATGKTFRETNTLSGWTTAATQVRGAQGAIVSRELLTVRYLNAPPHGYQEVTFATRYENSKVIETVTLQEEDGVWKVVGILID